MGGKDGKFIAAGGGKSCFFLVIYLEIVARSLYQKRNNSPRGESRYIEERIYREYQVETA